MATYYRVNLKDKKNNVVYPNIHNNITIDNDSGMMHLERKLGDTMFLCKRIDTGTEVRFGVGSGGTNHGIWSGPLAKWMVYADSTNVYLNGIAQKATSDKNGLQIDTSYLKLSGGNMTGDIQFNSKGLYWKEGTYGDQFKIIPNFSGIDDSNKLQIQGAVGEINTTPALYNLVTISGKSGNVWIKGNISINNGGVITKLMKTATTDTAPNHNQANLKLKAHTNAKYMPALSFEETGSSDGTLYMRNRALYWGSTTAISGEVPEANKGYKILHTGNFSNTTLSKLTSSLITNTHIAGNKGTAIINSTAAGNGYTILAKMNSTNGKFTMGTWSTNFNLFYTTNSVVNAGTNTYTKRLILLDESGNSEFPGTVKVPAVTAGGGSFTYTYTNAEAEKANKYYVGQATLTFNEFVKFDMDFNAKVNTADARNILLTIKDSSAKKTYSVRSQFNPNSATEALTCYRGSTKTVQIGPIQSYIEHLNVKVLYVNGKRIT